MLLVLTSVMFQGAWRIRQSVECASCVQALKLVPNESRYIEIPTSTLSRIDRLRAKYVIFLHEINYLTSIKMLIMGLIVGLIVGLNAVRVDGLATDHLGETLNG
jgi:hypothetical protein